MKELTIGETLKLYKVSRRDFLKFCTVMAGTLALPASSVPKIAKALYQAKKPTVIYLEFQDCCGNTESLLRAHNPTISQLILDVVSLDYQETIMVAAGAQAEKSLEDAIKVGGHIVIVEGSVPTAQGGVHCAVGGKTALSILQEATTNAAAVIAAGTCACYGGIPAASPNPTAAVGVRDLISNVPVINLSACPLNVDNLTALIVHYLSFGSWPALDSVGRPLFGYGMRIHDRCERRAHFDAGQYVETWGDEGHRQGYCLYHMGCKGPETYQNCPDLRWNAGTSWPIEAGHPCIGCAQPYFWDTLTPFYKRLPAIPGFGVEATADEIGLYATAAVAAGIGVHAIATAVREGTRQKRKKSEGAKPEETKKE
jgi:hydrogenase small subunit